MITPYRRSKITKDQEKFNFLLSSQRVRIEHVNGVLKSRFRSLQHLRIKVNRARGHRFACEWVTTCLILQNMLAEKDPWTVDTEIAEAETENENEMIEDDEEAKSKRNLLLKHVLSK